MRLVPARLAAFALALTATLAGTTARAAANSDGMGLGYTATCGTAVNVYFVWFAPIPNGPHGSFVSFANPEASGAPFVVEPITLNATANASLVGDSASVHLTADLDGNGAYTIKGQAPVRGCKLYPNPSGISVGN